MFKALLCLVMSVGFGAYAEGQEANLSDFATLTLRGSHSFVQDQLALELFRSLEAKPSETHRSNGYISCKQMGKTIYALVECRIDARDPLNRRFIVANIEMISDPFLGFEIKASAPEFFAGLKPVDTDWIKCEEKTCRFRVK